MRLINVWQYMHLKDWNRFDILLRLGAVTVFRLYIDVSDRDFVFELFNVRVEF